MKKTEKIARAKEIFDQLTALGTKLELTGDWVKITPPPPLELTMDLAKCGNELADLVRADKGNDKVSLQLTGKDFDLVIDALGWAPLQHPRRDAVNELRQLLTETLSHKKVGELKMDGKVHSARLMPNEKAS